MRGREGKGWAGKPLDPDLSRVFDPHVAHKREIELPIGERARSQVLDPKGIGMSAEVVFDDNVRGPARKTAKPLAESRTDRRLLTYPLSSREP